MTVMNRRGAPALSGLACRPRARSALGQLAVCLTLAFALGACAVARDAPRAAAGQDAAQVQPKPPNRDYPTQH